MSGSLVPTLPRRLQTLSTTTTTTISLALVALTSTGLLYYYHVWLSSFERDRRRHIQHRRRLVRLEDRYASLRIRGRFLNPFDEWCESGWVELLWSWLRRNAPLRPHIADDSFTELLIPKKPDFGLKASSAASARPSFDEDLSESWVSPSLGSSMLTSAESASPRSETLTFTWLGQSTCYITLDGLNILTDPVFSTHLKPMGTKRLHPPPCTISDLPKPDIVLVSHNHPDHLDVESVLQLADTATWYIPLGLRSWFVQHGVSNVVELDWWQEIHHAGRRDVIIAAIPSMHSSGTTPLTKNTTLWSSFLVKSPSATFFHCGATAPISSLHPHLGPITLAALPLAGCITPEQAVRMHKLLGARVSVGVHWGTYGEAKGIVKRVKEGCRVEGVEFGIGEEMKDGVRVVRVGESVKV